MPSAERYQGFLEALRLNGRVFDAAEHDEQRLDAALAVLRAVVLYLLDDHEVMDEHLIRPLGWLESAVNDAAQGADPTALKPATSASGRPTGLARDSVQGTLAFFLELLVVAAKVPPDQAAKFVARKSRDLVCSESGDQITAEQVKGWRSELRRGSATIGGREIFQGLTGKELQHLATPKPPAQYRPTVRIGSVNLEDMLCQIQPDTRNLAHGCPLP